MQCVQQNLTMRTMHLRPLLKRLEDDQRVLTKRSRDLQKSPQEEVVEGRKRKRKNQKVLVKKKTNKKKRKKRKRKIEYKITISVYQSYSLNVFQETDKFKVFMFAFLHHNLQNGIVRKIV